MMAKSDNGDLNISSSSSHNNDPNNSFMKKVTKHMSGLFPTSLSKWFGPSERQSTIRRRISIDEDEDDSSQIQPPPKKRVKPSDTNFTSTNSFTFTSSTPLINSRTDLRYLQPGPSGYSRHSTSVGTQSDVMQISPTVIVNGDDKSDSDDSNSIYNTISAKRNTEALFNLNNGNTTNQQTSKTALNKSLNTSLNSSRSLFSEQSLNPKKACMSSRRPSFNASTFGSPSFVDRTLSTKRVVNSPFYGGRTIYGGASAYRRNRIIFPRDESNSMTVKNSIQVKPVNETASNTDSMHLSKTARRILDVLENFTTPVSDARKIPPVNRSLLEQASCSSAFTKTPYSRERKPAPTKPLLIPGVPDLLKMKMKERLQDSTVQVRKVATTSKSILNSEYNLRKEEETKPQKSKIRTKVTSFRDKPQDVTDIVDSVKLPEVQLPITNLPKFDFTLPPPPTFNKLSESTKKQTETLTTNAKTLVSSQYKFAEPIIICSLPKSITSINKFKFSEPLTSTTSKQNSVVSSKTLNLTFKTFESSTSPKKKEASKNNGQNSNLRFTIQPSKELVSGSVMDILSKSDKTEEKTDTLMDKFKPAAGSWECASCMVRNIPSATHCISCEVIREPAKKVEQNEGFGNKFKLTADKWECSVCMVRNSNSESKCVSCTTPKPGATSTTTTTKPVPVNNFGDKFKPPAGSWECSICSVRNKEAATKCVSCEAAKPGIKTNTKLVTLPADTNPTNSGFADFLKKQQAQWECTSCLLRNTTDKNKCECCEAPKPGLPTNFKFGPSQNTTQFKFGIDKSSICGTTKTDIPTTFTFGVKPTTDKTINTKAIVSAAVSTTTTTGFTFGIPAASKSDIKDSETVTQQTSSTLNVSNKSVVSSTASTTIISEPVQSSITFGSLTNTTSSNICQTVTSSTPIFSFGNAVTSTQNSTPKSTLNLEAVSTAPVTSTTFSRPVTKPLNIFSSPSTTASANIFGNASAISTAASTTQNESLTKPTVSAALSTTPSPSTFTFEAPNQAKPIFGAGKSIPVPQFNFGASGLPFNPTLVTTNATTSASSKTTTVVPATSTQNTQSFIFNFGNNTVTTPSTKSEVKPFSFASSEPSAKVSAFSFASNKKPAPAPLTKVPVFDFGNRTSTEANKKEGFTATTTTSNSTFSFTASKNETATFGSVASCAGSSIFSTPAQDKAPQNGGFNFGTNTATTNFNFSSNSNPSQASSVFAFGASQAGSGSTAAGAGVFSFGGASTSTAQQTPAFSPDAKPNFNFTGGSAPNFSAPASWSPSPSVAARRTRKAIRRVQQR